MWKYFISGLFGVALLFLGGCGETDNSLTGSIVITFINDTQSGEPELFIVPGIFTSTTDTQALRELERGDMGDDTDVEYLIENLLPGSYSIKYRLEIPSNSFVGPEESKSFQIFAGERNLLNINI